MITLEQITQALSQALRESACNYVSEQMALCPQDVGQRLYDDPIVKIGSADDELWEELKAPEAIGHLFRTPKEWMAQAKALLVISPLLATMWSRVIVPMRLMSVTVGSMREWRVSRCLQR